MRWIKWVVCLFLKHKCQARGVDKDTRIIRCVRCDRRWIMNDKLHMIARYDGDTQFKEQLKLIHPELKGWDI